MLYKLFCQPCASEIKTDREMEVVVKPGWQAGCEEAALYSG